MSDDQPQQEYDINEVTVFLDTKGRGVRRLTSTMTQTVRFVGMGTAVITAHTQKGPVSQDVPVEFDIVGATSVKDAFDRYQAAGEEYGKKMNQRNNIIQATRIPPTLNFLDQLKKKNQGSGGPVIGGGRIGQ